MTDQIHKSVPALWFSFVADNIEHCHTSMPESFCLGIDKEHADNCAMLITANLKTASSGALTSYLNYQVGIPVAEDLAIITNWAGEAQCIIRTTEVDIIPFDEISEDHALKEGEGDQSLSEWKKTHWEFFSNDLANFGELPEEDMMVVCEDFEIIYQLPK
ncbi:MAG: hypothetical protein ACI976_002408 [Aureispira sp.]|jgi:uncharacterized protein YhfF